MRLLIALLIAITPAAAFAQQGDVVQPPVVTGEGAPPVSPSLTGAPVAPTDFQVVRLGDSNLSCEQLMTEINTLSAEASKGMNFDYSEVMPKGMGGMGMGMGGLGMLSGLDPTGISSMVAGKAMAAKAQADADKQMKKMDEQMALMQQRMALAQQQQQRVQHLQSLFQEKKC